MSCSREIEAITSQISTVKLSLDKREFSDARANASSAKLSLDKLEECIDREGMKDMGLTS